MSDPGVPGRIANLLPNAKILAILRNPIDRAYSGYCMWYRRGEVSSEIEAYLDPSASCWPALLENGLYFQQLLRFERYFSKSQMCILFMEELMSTKVDSLSKVYQFLGVDNTFVPERLESSSSINSASGGHIPPLIRRYLDHTKSGRNFAKLAKTLHLKDLIRRVLSRKIIYPPLSRTLRSKMIDYYQPEVDKLAYWLGRDLDDWLIKSE
jgi:hypothetical protein